VDVVVVVAEIAATAEIAGKKILQARFLVSAADLVSSFCCSWFLD
jgi:hypothetical protein